MIGVLGMLGAVIIGVLCMAPAARAQDEGPAIYVAWEYGVENAAPISKYRCVSYSVCPAGTLVLLGDGKFADCYDLGLFCRGRCAQCTGGGADMSRCELANNDSTCSPSAGGMTTCGKVRWGVCNKSGKGYQAPGGGCYCDIDIMAEPDENKVCKVISCLPDP